MIVQSEKSMNTFLLWMICEQMAGGRLNSLTRPHQRGEYFVATDCRRAAMVDAQACLPITTLDVVDDGKFPNIEHVFDSRDWTGLWVAVEPIARKCTIVIGNDDGDPDCFVPDYFNRHEDMELCGLCVDRELAWPFTLLANCMAKADRDAVLFRWETGRAVLMAKADYKAKRKDGG